MEITRDMTSLLAAGDWVGYIIPIIIALSILSKIFSKKKEGEEEDADTAPARPAGSTGGSKAASWEEEIKRLLEGQAPVEPPAPPPIVRPQPTPPPVPVIVVRREDERPERAPRPLPLPPVFSRPGPTEESEGHESHDLVHTPRMRQAEAVSERMSHFHETVAHQLESKDRGAGGVVLSAIHTHPRHRSAEVEAVMTLLRQPQTARQLLIAQAVLGQPKAMEG